MGTQPVSEQTGNTDARLATVKLASRACTALNRSAELTFLVGWSKGKCLEQVTIELAAEQEQAKQYNQLCFAIKSEVLFLDA